MTKGSVAALLANHDVVICSGSGGVGKTTTAAALGVQAARNGLRTIVLTIDPARRLADALGVSAVANEEVVVDVGGGAPLSAMMLDQKGAWDRMVERYAPSPEVRQRIFANHFYQHLSQSFAGSHEYMAVEQLSELRQSRRFDVIIVDTPPTRHALDFIEAPRRLADFLDRDIIRWFVKPYFSAGWATLRFVNRAVGSLLRRLEDATGVSALIEISDFFNSMSGLFEGFAERVEEIYRVFRAKGTAFVLVASPDEHVLSEAASFHSQLADLSIRLAGVVFNRVHRPTAGLAEGVDAPYLRRLIRDAVGTEGEADALHANFLRYEREARGEAARMQTFRRHLPDSVVSVAVPNFEQDLHDLPGLDRMLPYLVGERSVGDDGG